MWDKLAGFYPHTDHLLVALGERGLQATKQRDKGTETILIVFF